MLERKLHSETEQKPNVHGVVLFVTDQYGNALLFQNNRTKESTQKIRGQLTTPAETIERGEDLRRDALPRAIAEEVGYIPDVNPINRGIVRIDTLTASIIAICLEIPTSRESIKIDPMDKDELSFPRWVPLADIDDRTMRIGSWDVPLYRTFLPELASNVLRGREHKSFSYYQRVKSVIPPQLFNYLEENPGPVYPVK